MRLTQIDGFRGIFLVFMLIIHANGILKTVFGKLNHHYFGWVEDAQGFVFISGLVVGLVYGGRYLRYGYDVMHQAIWSRIKTIYSHQLFLILLFVTLAFLFSRYGGIVPDVLVVYERSPVLFPTLSALLVTGSLHMGILPMYIFFMMATPFALRLLRHERYGIYAIIMFSFWALAQTQVIDHVTTLAEIYLANNVNAVGLGIFFNIFGWQVLFFGGLLIGFLMASNRLDASYMQSADMRGVFFVCVALFFIFGIYDRIVFDDWFGSAFSEGIKSEVDRGNFSTIYVVTFAVDLFIVCWLAGPGMTDRNTVVRGAARMLHYIVTFRPVVFLGQHSLHVFTAHIVITYALAFAYPDEGPGEVTGTALILLSIVMLYIVAWFHAKSVERKKRAQVT